MLIQERLLRRAIAMVATVLMLAVAAPLIAPAAAQAQASTPAVFTPLDPTRVLDTRDGTGGTAGVVGEDASINLQVTGVAGVPALATAVVLNVTVTAPSANSFLTVFPAGTTLPTASNINFVAGQTIPNLVTVALGDGGAVSFYNKFGTAHVIADVSGYYAAKPTTNSGGFVGISPVRVMDTRDGTGVGAPDAIGPEGFRNLKIPGTAGIPVAGVSAVVLNVTATGTTADGFLTVHPAGGPPPNASNLNWKAGETFPNQVIVPIGEFGDISFFNKLGSAHVIADVAGYFTVGGAKFAPLNPARLLDTRNGTGGTSAPVGQDSTISLKVTGKGGVPATGVSGVVLNVTATDTTADSFLTVWPGGVTQPLASNLNYVPGETFANLVHVSVPPNGIVNFYNKFGSANVIADVAGYYTAGAIDTFVRVNAGGPAIGGATGWEADTVEIPSEYNTSPTSSVAAAPDGTVIDVTGPSIPAGTEAAIFGTERFVSSETPFAMQWDFPVPVGAKVEVRLFFAETFVPAQAVGGRVFDVAIDGKVELKNYDIFAAAGAGNTGVMETFDIIGDGLLSIDFDSTKAAHAQNPSVSAIEVEIVG